MLCLSHHLQGPVDLPLKLNGSRVELHTTCSTCRRLAKRYRHLQTPTSALCHCSLRVYLKPPVPKTSHPSHHHSFIFSFSPQTFHISHPNTSSNDIVRLLIPTHTVYRTSTISIPYRAHHGYSSSQQTSKLASYPPQ